MELKDQIERIAVAKPVAWKPSPSKFQSFSALLASDLDRDDDDDDDHDDAPSPPPLAISDRKLAVTAAIRPKTVRLKLAASIVRNQDPAFVNNINSSFKAELPEAAPVLYSSSTTSGNVIYKPLARAVTRNSHSVSDHIMAQPNMDDYDHDHDLDQQALALLMEKHSSKSEPSGTSKFSESPSLYETNKSNVKRAEASKIIEQNKSFPPWYDGYTWRKYGQKQVKGSEYPRSYYKCTHPNCPVKKMIERSLSGKIEEVVYKGEHNHSKPRSDKRSVTLGGFNQITRELEGESSRGVTNVGMESKYCYQGLGKALEGGDHDGDGNNSNNEPKLIKRRKTESDRLSDPGYIFGEETRNDKASVESETTGDTYRWRKYGQKAVKGNPYPRSYYRCTDLKCTARKYLERSSDDPNALITTYEGKHNHDMPPSSKAKF